MLEINAAFGQEGQNLGLVGRTGENASRRIVFDCEAVLGEFPGAGIVCALRRACDAEAYAKELTAEGKKRLLTLSAADVAAPGSLMIELRAVEADAIRKSAVYVGRIERGLSGQGDAPGNPVADTINSLESRAKEASAAAAAAQAVANEVQAKLEAGEFKGDKGDKGDPGSDAEVTAENIQSALGYAPVKDVQVDGSSVLDGGVANVPIASATKPGVIRIGSPEDSGMYVDRYGNCYISYATNPEIDSRAAQRKTIICSNLDYAVTAAMTDGKGPAWTAAQQAAARERIGVSAEFELIEEITLSEDVMNVAREAFPDGTPYNLRSLIIVVDSTNVENRPDVGGCVRLNTKLPASEWTYIAYGDFITTNDSFSCFVYRVLSDGSVDSYFTRTINATPTSYTSDRIYIPSNVIRFGMHINDFFLYSISNAIPANTKIAIYGVRA